MNEQRDTQSVSSQNKSDQLKNQETNVNSMPTQSLPVPIEPKPNNSSFDSSPNYIETPRSPSPRKRNSQRTSNTPSNNIFFSDSECGTDSADSIILEEDIVISDRDIQRFLSSKPDDLKIKDIAKLLAIFKQLHTENLKLKEALETTTNPLPVPTTQQFSNPTVNQAITTPTITTSNNSTNPFNQFNVQNNTTKTSNTNPSNSIINNSTSYLTNPLQNAFTLTNLFSNTKTSK